MLIAVSFAPFSAVLWLVGSWFWYLLTRLEGPCRLASWIEKCKEQMIHDQT